MNRAGIGVEGALVTVRDRNKILFSLNGCAEDRESIMIVHVGF